MTQLDNAKALWAGLAAAGFAPGPIAGILGNAQAESGIIPDRWEGDRVGNTAGGYGLLQWTPSSKLISWAQSEGLNAASMGAQIARIVFEVNTGTQFAKPGQTFKQWSQSNISAAQAADDFVRYYERPAVVNSATRQQFANYWYNLLHGTPAASVPAPSVTHNADGSETLVVDGNRGSRTISRWEEVMGTPIDGTISSPKSTLIAHDQAFLNKVVTSKSIHDLTGKSSLVVDSNEGVNTIKVRQFYLFNKYAQAVLHRPAALSDFDGINGVNTNKLLQYALNHAKAHSGKY